MPTCCCVAGSNVRRESSAATSANGSADRSAADRPSADAASAGADGRSEARDGPLGAELGVGHRGGRRQCIGRFRRRGNLPQLLPVELLLSHTQPAIDPTGFLQTRIVSTFPQVETQLLTVFRMQQVLTEVTHLGVRLLVDPDQAAPAA